MIWRKMGMPGGHGDCLVPRQFLNLLDRRSRHRQPTAKCVAVAVPDVATRRASAFANSRSCLNAALPYSVTSSKRSGLHQKTNSSPARESSPRTNSSADPNRRTSAAQPGFLKGCKAICDWLASEGISGPCGAQIVNEARSTLAIAEQNNPRDAAPPGIPVTEIIQRCRPAEPNSDATSYIAWFTRWLSCGPLTRSLIPGFDTSY